DPDWDLALPCVHASYPKPSGAGGGSGCSRRGGRRQAQNALVGVLVDLDLAGLSKAADQRVLIGIEDVIALLLQQAVADAGLLGGEIGIGGLLQGNQRIHQLAVAAQQASI